MALLSGPMVGYSATEQHPDQHNVSSYPGETRVSVYFGVAVNDIQNNDMRRKTEQPRLSATVQARRLSVFDHIA